VKAIICRRYGPPDEALELADIDPPVLGDGEVLVQVGAASANAADWHMIRGVPYFSRLQMGLRRPRVSNAGSDFAGEVEAVGAGVTTVRPGDAVYGTAFMRGFGAFAEKVAVAEDLVEPKPANLSFEEAAAVPLAALTALQSLRDDAGVRAGDSVLIIGASGGVGTFAVQIAKALGAEVTGVCRTRNVDLVRSLGADHVVDYTAEDVTRLGRRHDVVLQVAGTLSASACRRHLLTPDGTLALISGDSPGRWLGPVGRIARGLLQSPFVSQRITLCQVKASKPDLHVLRDLIEKGDVRPVIDRTYSLDEAVDAVTYQDTGHARGKVVITV
jgi:NADPH:quinone reductase-like Zn-dependent oxidoreductase